MTSPPIKKRRRYGADWRMADDSTCECCGSDEHLEWDHIIPWSKGGSNARSNLQILCHRCNFSKGVGPACTINHRLDVMIQNPQEIQQDNGSGDGVMPVVERSRSKIIKGPNPQVNWRVEDEIKREIEDTAKRRGVGAGEVIKELWRSQHAELYAMTREILDVVRQQHVAIPPQTLPPADVFAHAEMHPTQRHMAPVASLPVVQAHRPVSRWRLCWRRLWA